MKWRMLAFLIDLCAIEYSFGDTQTALKHGDEACLHIWHLMWNLYIVSPNLSCELLTEKMNLLKKYFSAIWFLTFFIKYMRKFWLCLGKFVLSSLFSKINWNYHCQDVSATIWDQKFMFKSDLYGSVRLHLGIKMKVSSVSSTWCIRFWHTIYRHQMMTQILKSAYN